MTGRHARGPAMAVPACCALALWAAGAVAQAPSLTPQGFPLAIGPDAASVGGEPAIAFDGGNFFVVWRTSAGEIAGGRITTAGVLLDPGGIPLGTGSGTPSVAFDGANFFVVWEDGGEARGARVTQAGAVLDNPALTLTSGAASKIRPVTIAFGDTTFLIAWRDGSDNLYAARISRSGVNLDWPTGVYFGRGFYPWAAFDGTNFLVVWYDNGNGLDVFGNRLSQDGAPLDGTGFAISTDAEGQEHPSVAFDGTNYLVAWHDTRGGADDGRNDGTPRAVRVSPAGAVLDNPALVVADNARGPGPVVAAFDGTNFIVAWMVDMMPAKSRLADAFGRRIAGNGTFVDPLPIPLAAGFTHQFGPLIGAGANAYFVVWNDGLNPGRCYNGCIYGQVLGQATALPDPFTSSSAPTPANWQLTASSTSQPLYAIWGIDGGSAYAVGERAVIVHYDGTAWGLVTEPDGRLFGVWGARDNDVWAVGWGWGLVQYDGLTLTEQGCGGPNPFPAGMAMWGAGDEILTVGAEGGFARYPGIDWCPRPTGVRWSLWDVWGTSMTNAYAVGEFGTVLRYDGSGWTIVTNIPTRQSLNSIWGSGPNDVFAVGDFGTIVHYDGATWTLQSSGSVNHLFGVWGVNSSHVYAVGLNGTILRYDGTSWNPEASGVNNHLLDVGIGGGEVWVVGDQGIVLHTSVLALALSVTSRLDSVALGSATPRPDSADVQITGPGASAADWSARHGSSTWLTLTSNAGSGPGTLRWSRDPSGLAVGAYVDTITIAVAGAAGSPARLVDTLVVEPALALAVSLESRHDSVAEGTIAPRPDSATITLTGFGAGAAAWSATHAAAATWVSLTTDAGTGSGMLRWIRDPSALGVGTYIDTITVTVAGAVGSPARVVDTLVVEPVLALALSPGSRRDSVAEGTIAPRPDSAAVTLSGFGAATAAWSASHGADATWVTLTSNAGTGSGTLRWSRGLAGVPVGTYIDTITVTVAGAAGSPARLVDTLIVEPALALALSPGSHRDSVAEGSSTPRPDSAAVTLSGFGAVAAGWSATHGSATWVNLTTSAGTGSGVVRWARDPAGLAVGTYIDTIIVTVTDAVGSPAQVVDTLLVETGLALVLSPGSRRDSVVVGTSAPRADSAAVTLTGFEAAAAGWSAAHGSATWVNLTASAGTGSGTVRWTRNPTGLTAGTYIDTIVLTVPSAMGSPARLVDSLVVEPVLALALTPGSRRDSVVSGAGTPRVDSATVTLTGFGAVAAGWLATHDSATTWVTLTTSAGTGSGTLRWSRDPTGLAVGTYIDTLSVTVGGAVGSPARLTDTLIVAQALTLAAGPTVRYDTTFAGLTGVRTDSATLTFSGDGAASAAWSATHRSAATWVALTTSAGTGSGMVRWTRSYSGLTEGPHVDSIMVTAAGATGSPVLIVDSLMIRTPPVTSPVVVDAILDGTPLTPEQVAYLDLLGNHNGRFDLGDFLAWALQHPDQVNVQEMFPRLPQTGVPVRRSIRNR